MIYFRCNDVKASGSLQQNYWKQPGGSGFENNKYSRTVLQVLRYYCLCHCAPVVQLVTLVPHVLVDGCPMSRLTQGRGFEYRQTTVHVSFVVSFRRGKRQQGVSKQDSMQVGDRGSAEPKA